MEKQIQKLLNHALEGLRKMSVYNKNGNKLNKRERTAQDGSVAHKHQSAKDFRRFCEHIKLAVNTLEVIAEKNEKIAANIGGYEQASAFARRKPFTRYRWSERNATFGLLNNSLIIQTTIQAAQGHNVRPLVGSPLEPFWGPGIAIITAKKRHLS